MTALRHLPVTFLIVLFASIAAWQGLRAADGSSPTVSTPRERLSFNEGWRFQKNDPADGTVSLRYDVRPEIGDARENQVADARPQEAELVSAAGADVLKPWILPSGNGFIGDPSRRHRRPAGDPGASVSYVQEGFDDSAWQAVRLPHDWAIGGPFIEKGDVGGMGRLPSWGIGWYRKKFRLPAQDAGRRIILEVDGAMAYAAVWLNGHLVGGWPYGYASWQLDLTPHVVFGGDNQLCIRLDNPPASSRWYPGGGLYRNVWLTKAGPVRVAQWGTHLKTRDADSEQAQLDLRTTLVNDTGAPAAVRVETQVFALDISGRRSGPVVAEFAAKEVAIGAGLQSQVQASATITKPRLWGPPPDQQPNLYVAVTTVMQADRVLDVVETRFGVRTLRFDPDTGLHVNGKPVRIQGVCLHHDLGALGAAFNLRAAQRQLEMLREMGCNAIRISHNPPAPEFLDLTDEMGFVVMDEAFDCWERKKTPLDFHLIFPDWHEQDLRALVRRDRNHPSVVFWSLGNEVGEQYTDVAGAALAARLGAIVHEEDGERPTTSGMNWAKPGWPLPGALDVIGVNYQGQGIRQRPEFEGVTGVIRTAPNYDEFRARHPGKMILGSETASAISTRGTYLFPVTAETSDIVRDGRGGDLENHFVSAYELYAVDFGSSADKVFTSLAKHPFVAGEFVWTGWDHLGEPTPYYDGPRGSYCGIIDMAGFKKDRFYLYQSRWRPQLPMAHILPHWTWPERQGLVTPVHVFTSGDEAELFLNGRSLGRKKKGDQDHRLRWDDVVYESGKLEVVAYKDGLKWASDRVQTTGAAAALEASPDRASIRADGLDLCFVTVRVTDVDGLTVPRAMHALKFKVEGPGEFVAADNGDPTSFEPFQLPQRRAFNGLCTVILRAKPGETGKIRLTVSSDGLSPAVTTIAVPEQPVTSNAGVCGRNAAAAELFGDGWDDLEWL